MKSGIRKAIVFLSFIGVLAVLLALHSKELNRFSSYLIGAFGLLASITVVIRTVARRPGMSYSHLGWGNPLSVLPPSWQRWLLDEYPKDTKKAR